MSQNVDILDPGSLPVDPREAAMLLLGMTAGELRSIDEKVVSGRNSVGGIRSDINKIVSDIRSIKPSTQQPQPQPVHTAVVPPPVVLPAPELVPQPAVIPQAQPLTQDDPDQLQFDFYKKIKPEDIEYQLRLLKSSLDNIDSKLTFLVENYKKKDIMKANGDHTQ
jgi:hypothetical protein